LEKLNFLIGSYIGTVKAMFSFRLWTPFLIFALISLVVVLLFANPFIPVIGPLVSGLAEFIGGSEAVSHYPDLFVFLPKTYGWVTLVLSVFLEILFIGAGFLMFTAYYRNERIGFGKAVSGASKKYFQIVAVWLFYYVILLLLLTFLPKLFDPLIGGSPRRTMAFSVLLRLAGTFLLAMLMYVLPYLLVDGERLLTAIGRSIKTCFKNPFSSYTLALIPYLLMLPLSIALFSPATIVRKFSPELVLYLIIVEIVVNMIASFIFVSSVLRFYWEYAE